MSVARLTQLCLYRYDPLDRLASRTPLATATAQAFYCRDTLASEIQATEQRRLLHHDRHLLALQNVVGKLATTALTCTDAQRSVLHADNTAMAYTPYGHRQSVSPLPSLPGFNGEQPDPITGHYLLGNGYRAYNPTLMRFNSPDSASPFGDGGFNAYAYCAGDPVNRSDPTGHAVDSNDIARFAWIALGFLGAAWGLRVASPALKAVAAGGAKPSQWLSAAGAVGQVAASTTFVASRVIDAVEPGSPIATDMLWVALALGVPSLLARASGFYVGRWEVAVLARAEHSFEFHADRTALSGVHQSSLKRNRYRDSLELTRVARKLRSEPPSIRESWV